MFYGVRTGWPKIAAKAVDSAKVREDTHTKSVFLSGRTTKGVEKLTPTRPLNKKQLFFYKSGFFSPQIGEEKNPFQAIIRLKKIIKKVAWTTKPLV